MTEARLGAAEIFLCPDCGHETVEAVPRCPACGRWHQGDLETKTSDRALYTGSSHQKAVSAATAPEKEVSHIPTSVAEFDQVLGGGVYRGSAVLVAGPPGVGKSSLLMFIAARVAASHGPVVYLSAEESLYQAAARAKRIGADHEDLYILANGHIEAGFSEAARLEAALVVVDSLQLAQTSYVDSPPGSALQVREVASRVVEMAKKTGTPYLVTGQVVKTGEFAGPMSIPHIFDVFLRLDPNTLPGFVLLRSEKNRFGSVLGVGSFRMTPKGMIEAPHPSKEILSTGATGIVAVSLEGTKPIAAMIQALSIGRSDSGAPTLGYPKDRLAMIRIACHSNAGVEIPKSTVIDVLGGYKITDPAADLAVAIAACFAKEEKPLPSGWAAIGEIDLSGRVLPPRDLFRRVSEIEAVEIPRVVIPFQASEDLPQRGVPSSPGIRRVRVKTIKKPSSLSASSGRGRPPDPQTPGPADARERTGRPREGNGEKDFSAAVAPPLVAPHAARAARHDPTKRGRPRQDDEAPL